MITRVCHTRRQRYGIGWRDDNGGTCTMNYENTEKLFQDFPEMFDKQLLQNGFECQDGWFGLLYVLASQIMEHRIVNTLSSPVTIVEVKQKMGALAISVHDGDETTKRLIRNAEEQSANICELDGEPATGLFVCAPRWFRHLCRNCAELHGCMTMADFHAQLAEKMPQHERYYN